ncbi:MAG: bacillithiol biosynthesis deacetylase BshB1, partial [Parafilimonas sp.]
MKTDILAFGVHPDDVELGCSGTLVAAIHEGKTVVVIDLTRGELGTRGTADIRDLEAASAAKVMGIHARENLQMADGFFLYDEAHLRKVIIAIRKYKPEIILCNAPEDRHPDHGRSSKLVTDAAFLSGLRKIETMHSRIAQEAWRPSYVFHYIQDKYLKPDFLFDVSSFHEKKIEAILCYTTQFTAEASRDKSADSSEPETYISTPDFIEIIK